MPRAIFVSLSHTYSQIADPSRENDALRNCTCGWWRVALARIVDVRYVFGVFGGDIVSAYKIDVPGESWPVMPANALGAGRRYIPVNAVTVEEWGSLVGCNAPEMYGAVRYGDVEVEQGNGCRVLAMDESPNEADTDP